MDEYSLPTCYREYFFPWLVPQEWAGIIIFLVALEFWTLRLELRLARCPTIKGVFCSMFLARHFSFFLTRIPNAWEDSTLWIWVVVGMCFYACKQFSVAYILGHIPAYERQHVEYRQRLVFRKLLGIREHRDDLVEILALLFSFWCTSIVVWNAGFWLGVALVQFLDHVLCSILEYTPNEQLQNKFLREANACYWYPILVHPKACFGRVSLFYDILFCGLPCAGACPLPFMGFFWSDAEFTFGSRIEKAWKRKRQVLCLEEKKVAFS